MSSGMCGKSVDDVSANGGKSIITKGSLHVRVIIEKRMHDTLR